VARESLRLLSVCHGSQEGIPRSSGAGCSGEVGGDDVGGVAVECAAGAVVAAGLARVGMPCEVLNVTQIAAGIERGGDRGVSERVGRDGLVDPRAFREPAHDPPGSVSIQTAAVRASQ